MRNLCAVTLCLLLVACDSKKSPGSPSSAPGGGSAASTGSASTGEASLEIPEGAFDGEVKVTAASKDPAQVPGRVSVGRLWDVRVNGAEHTEFLKPVLIRVPFDASKVPAGKGVLLMTQEEGRWRPLPSSRVEGGFVVAAVTHLSNHQPVLMDEDIRVVARWYGQTVIETRGGETLFGPPNGTAGGSDTKRTAFIVVREEALRGPLGGDTSRFMIETAGVGIALNEITGITKDKRVIRFRDAVNTSQSASGEAMVRHDRQIDAALDQVSAELEKAERELARAVQARERATNTTEADAAIRELQEQVADLRHNVRLREFYAGAMSTSMFQAQLQDDGNWNVSAQCEHRSFEYVHPGYDISAFTNPPFAQGPARPEKVSLTTHFTGFGAGNTLSSHDEHAGSNSSFSQTTTFTRVPVIDGDASRELRVTGQVLYRLHVPKASAPNWFGASPTEAWSDLKDTAIPVAGKARLEAFLLEPGEMVERGAANSVVTEDDATFELKLPLRPMKILRLRLAWKSTEAQMDETCELDVPLWQVVAAAESIPGAGSAPLTGIERRTKARVRYAQAPREFDLGRELRGAQVLKDARGNVSLEFREIESLFLNSFVRAGTHLNQNVNTFKVRVADRRNEIFDRCPQALRADVDARLLAEALDGTTMIEVKGNEVCFPSSTLMALDTLGVERIVLDAAGVTPLLPELAQAVYDQAHELTESTDTDDKVVWTGIPVPSLQQAQRADALIAAGNAGQAETILAEFRKTWPFGPASGRNKYWLMTVPGDYRPWQVGRLMSSTLRKRYPGIEITDSRDGAIDPFGNADAGRQLLRKLGDGASGVISITHLSGNHDREADGRRAWNPSENPGGHLLCAMGAVMSVDGRIVRLVVNDPHGDLSRHPDIVGYYDTRDCVTGDNHEDVQDVDNSNHHGAWAPYGIAPHPTRAWADGIAGKYFSLFRVSSAPATPSDVRQRLLPGVR
jgi:hypothetical protein